MASEWNLWVWLECIGVVSGCCCKEVQYIDILIIIISFLYTPIVYISSFLATASLFLYTFFYPSSTSKAKTMSRSIIVHTLLSLRILHSLEHSHFMGGFLAECAPFFAVMHLPLVSIGNAYSFLTSLYMQNHIRKAQCLSYGNRHRNYSYQ